MSGACEAGRMTSKTVRSVRDLLSECPAQKITEKKLAYRGHGAASWELETRLERLCGTVGLPVSESFNIERTIFEEFKSKGHLHFPRPPALWDRLAQLAYIQHYGGPTRLLDVTFSPLFATFFAVEDPRAETDRAVVRLELQAEDTLSPRNDRASKSADKFFAPEKLDDVDTEPFLWRPRALHERLARQDAAFLLWVDLRKPMKETIRRTQITKYIIPRARRRNVLQELREMGVSRELLFEGPDGWVQSLDYHAWALHTTIRVD